ncbi:GNAT family N-acetyltransferase [Neobacillus dielmonensis]|uniref:GNAT family N-acetyltransferase n=1 Tax=Neobacillus dielmonensis TaxID=1347369 RepID=UPI0005AA6B6B|nr:GNAT family protein [Neobacillus dielmonensis]
MSVRFLEGQQVYLRPISLEDTDFYFSKLYDPETRKLTGTQLCYTIEQIYQYIERKGQDSSSLLLLICVKESDQVIGDIALQDIDHYNRNANIRISIDVKESRGKGYGSEAMKLLLDYGFGIVNLHRIELNVFAYNEVAFSVYKKLGFKQEGVQRDALFYDHQYHDSITMSILENEFRLLHEK